MRFTYYQSLPGHERRALRRRVTTLVLVLIAHLLIMILLFMPGAPIQRLLKEPPKVFSVLSYTEAKKAEKPAPRAKKAGKTAPKLPARPVQPTAMPAPTRPLNMMILSKQDFAATDISKMAHSAAPAGDNGTGKMDGGNDGAGEGPGGEKLYNAEWYKEPSHAELAPYLANVHQSGWGEIACRTIERFRVEDCRELGESPSGSGISRALRQAAFQFLVRPPRVGGKQLVGAWVRIHFDLTERLAP